MTDTFGVRSLIRPIGDPAIPPAHLLAVAAGAAGTRHRSARAKVVTNRFFLPPTLSRTIDSAPLEDVLFMRDEMANLAWAIERTVESPIEQPAQRYEAPDAGPVGSIRSIRRSRPAALPAVDDRCRRTGFRCCRCRCRIPLFPNTPGQILSRLKRGAVLQPDGSKKVHIGAGRGAAVASATSCSTTRRSRARARGSRASGGMARWTDGSTWLWTSFRNQVGQGEGSSQLRFDQVHRAGRSILTTARAARPGERHAPR